MAEKELRTRIQLKYDSYANWSSTTLGDGKGANLVLKLGEVGICAIPSGVNAAGVQNPPHVMFKVGDGTTPFSGLEWTSAKAADVYAWAKQASLPVTKEGDGNVVSGIVWDEATKGIKFTTASVATSEGLENLIARVKTIEDTYATDEELAAAVSTINEAITLKADKTYVDIELGKKVAVADFNTFKTENTAAIGTAKSEAIAAAKTETGTQVGALRDGAVKDNADAIAAIKDHDSVDSFADVMTEMAKYQLAGDYATKAEAQGYANAKDAAIAEAKKAGTDAAAALEAYKTSNDAAVNAKASAQDLADEVQRAQNAESGLATRIGNLEKHDHSTYELKTDAAAKLTEAKGYTNTEVAKVQGEVDALETLVGTLPEGTTAKDVVDYVNIKTAGIATDAALAELQNQLNGAQEAIDAIEADYLKAADKTELSGLIAAEKERAMGVEGGLETRLAAVEGDYLKAADKEALQNQINTILSNPDAEGAINSINEFTQWVNDHGTVAEGMRTDINQNKADIAAEVARATAAEQANAKAIADQATSDAATYETKADATAKLTEAKGHADSLNTAMDTRVKALEAIDHDAYKAYADQAEADANAYADSLATNYATAAQGAKADSALQEVTTTANGGLKVTNKNQIDIDDSVVFVFNCGSSTEVI